MKSYFGRFVAAVVTGTAVLGMTADAATTTYTGAGTNANWSTAANWTPTPAVNNDDLVLAGPSRKTMNNDVLTSVNSMSFTSGGFTLNGNGLTINSGGSLSSGAGTNIIQVPIIVTDTLAINTTSAGGALRLGGGLDGSNTIIKSGAGSLELNGTNTFAGTMNLSQGQLVGNGLSPAMNVVAVGGTISAGPVGSTGEMTTGAMTLGPGATSQFTINDTSDFDQIDINGNLAYGGALNLAFNDATLLPNFTNWSLYDFTGSQSGSFSSVNWAAASSPYTGLSFTQDPISGLFVSGTFTGFGGGQQYFAFENATGNLVLVPEPSTIVFAAIGAAISGWHCINKRRRSRAVIAG